MCLLEDVISAVCIRMSQLHRTKARESNQERGTCLAFPSHIHRFTALAGPIWKTPEPSSEHASAFSASGQHASHAVDSTMHDGAQLGCLQYKVLSHRQHDLRMLCLR